MATEEERCAEAKKLQRITERADERAGMTERLNAGRRREREEWERSQALSAGTQPEV